MTPWILPVAVLAVGDRAATLRGGQAIGIDQRITPLEGLKSMTLWGAEQYGEAASKGSLQAGKLADLVILDRNPLKVDADDIKDIRVVETIKEGTTIYRRGDMRTAQ